MMKYLLGLDIGTSATKTVLFDETMKVIASASEEYPMYQPQNGWAEQNPKDWYNASLHTIQEVLAKSKINPEDVKGVLVYLLVMGVMGSYLSALENLKSILKM